MVDKNFVRETISIALVNKHLKFPFPSMCDSLSVPVNQKRTESIFKDALSIVPSFKRLADLIEPTFDGLRVIIRDISSRSFCVTVRYNKINCSCSPDTGGGLCEHRAIVILAFYRDSVNNFSFNVSNR